MQFRVILFCLLSLLFIATTGLADTDKVLNGIQGVRVFVYLSEDSGKSSLTETKVTTEVELLLRQYGIKVLSQEEYRQFGAALSLDVRANYEYSVSGTIQGYYSIVSLKIKEYSYLARENNKTSSSPYLMTTWGNSIAFTGPHQKLREQNLDAIKDMVKSFVNAYLSVNTGK